jgi:glycosyltransferase involved in cell wall biosynthesis
MAPPLAFDLTHLFVAPVHRTPRGIDRIEMGLAVHFFREWPGDCFATLPTPWGVRAVSRAAALRFLETLCGYWGEDSNPDREELFTEVKQKIVKGPDAPNVRVRWRRSSEPATPIGVAKILLHPETTGGLLKIARHAECLFGRRATATLPQGTVYLSTGHTGIALPRFTRWLGKRPDIKPVFMLHDVIPFDHAEYFAPAARRFHQNMIDNTVRYAAGLIATTNAAKTSILREIRRSGGTDIPVFAEHLPVAEIFARGPDRDAELAAAPYFVIAGVIEPRKNHILVLNVWRELVAREGKTAPKLVVIGTRAHAPDAVADILERSTLLKDHVIEAAGLSSPALRRLFSNATALLMPSFAEGFGLPIVEALALGTPVIASDIAAHREAGGDYATYLNPIDGMGWLTAIQAIYRDPAASRRKIAGYKAWTWIDYHKAMEPFLLSVHAEGRRPASVGSIQSTDKSATAAPLPS